MNQVGDPHRVGGSRFGTSKTVGSWSLYLRLAKPWRELLAAGQVFVSHVPKREMNALRSGPKCYLLHHMIILAAICDIQRRIECSRAQKDVANGLRLNVPYALHRQQPQHKIATGDSHLIYHVKFGRRFLGRVNWGSPGPSRQWGLRSTLF